MSIKTTLHNLLSFSLLAISLILPTDSAFSFPGFRNQIPKIGICTSFEKNALIAGSGCTFIEENVRNFLVPDKSDEEFNARLILSKQSKLPVTFCNSFLPGGMKSVGPDAVPADILKFTETAFKRAKLSGVKIIVFGSGGSRAIPQGFPREEALEQFTDLCRKIAMIAKKYDVIMVLEPLNTKECNFINSVAEGGDIVRAVNHPNFRLLADLYHMKMEGESPLNLIKYGSLLHHVHIAEKEGRAAPGTSDENFSEYFVALKKIKYKGAISIECSWKNLGSQAPLAIQTIKDQWRD
jgi:sugar phosphate isomerase/epimerase